MYAQYIPFILFTVVTNAAAQILLKKGMTQVGVFSLADGVIPVTFRILFNGYVFLGLTTFVISMASHLFVLSRVDVSFAYPFLSIAYVLVAVYAHMFLDESVTLTQAAGIALICGGTVLIGMKTA